MPPAAIDLKPAYPDADRARRGGRPGVGDGGERGRLSDQAFLETGAVSQGEGDP
ncbi:MAG: hypothetical protein MUO67_14610 [Anaerolineales bacterium]|jgi:hypothetical protein|nr:hypothetical protein [Anaerolineales bacterium]